MFDLNYKNHNFIIKDSFTYEIIGFFRLKHYYCDVCNIKYSKHKFNENDSVLIYWEKHGLIYGSKNLLNCEEYIIKNIIE